MLFYILIPYLYKFVIVDRRKSFTQYIDKHSCIEMVDKRKN